MILVTGGTGLIGTYLLYELASHGIKVRALIRPGRSEKFRESLFNCFSRAANDSAISMSTDGTNTNIESTIPSTGTAKVAFSFDLSNIEWVEGDVLDTDSIEKAMAGITGVYHCAGMISFNPAEREEMLRINIQGTANIVDSCIKHKVDKLIHVSSISALGTYGKEDKSKEIDESVLWDNSATHSGYGTSKYYGEVEVWKGIERGLNAVIVNPSVIIGAGSHPKAVTPIFKGITNMLPFYTRGVTGYIDVKDVVKAMILLMNSNIISERFVLNAENLAQRELFNMCALLLGRRKPFIYLGKPLLKAAWLADSLRVALSKSPPAFTLENVRTVTGINRYSSDKFKKQFEYEFIPIKESLRNAFEVLGMIS